MPFSIVTCYKEGDSYRRKNLDKFIGWCQSRFPSAELVIIEQDNTRRLDIPGVTYAFQQWNGLFNRSWALNAGARIARNETLLVTDCDLLIEAPLIEEGAQKISLGADFARLGEYMLDLTEEASEAFTVSSVYDENLPSTGRRGLHYCAGAYMCTKSALRGIGWHDEGFQGWGGEDDEFLDRVVLFTPPEKLSGCLSKGVTHLWHPQFVRENPMHGDNVQRILSRKGWNQEQMRSFLASNDESLLGTLTAPYLFFGDAI